MTDQPTDQPTDRPTNRQTNQPTDRPMDREAYREVLLLKMSGGHEGPRTRSVGSLETVFYLALLQTCILSLFQKGIIVYLFEII